MHLAHPYKSSCTQVFGVDPIIDMRQIHGQISNLYVSNFTTAGSHPLQFRSMISSRRWASVCGKFLSASQSKFRDKKCLSLYRSPTTCLVQYRIEECNGLAEDREYSRSPSCCGFDKSSGKNPIDSRSPHHRHRFPPYQIPTVGLISYLPQSWAPYAELIRLDKPTGTYYLLFPCLFSTLMAANYSAAPPFTVASTCILFAAGSLIMRGAGCSINDLWDRDLDPHVNRTQHRPIARGAITPFNALAFTGLQLLAGLGILSQFPTSCLFYGIPSLLLVAMYPLAKRVTHYPQVVLGLTFSWGAIMGFPALGIDLLTDATASKTVAALYASCTSWTVLYDMIYAHMDITDDKKVGIKSIALRHASHTKAVLSTLAVAQVGLLAASGVVMSAGPVFLVSSCGSAAATLGLMIWKVNLEDMDSCWWWFKYGAWFTGGGITVGLLADYLMNVSRCKGEPRNQITRNISDDILC